MAKHKAATEVTLVPTEERRGFALFVETYWKPMAALAVVIAVAILVVQFLGQQKEKAKDQSWATLSGAVEQAALGGILGEPDQLQTVSQEVQGTIAGPWSLYMLALSLQQERRFPEAAQTLQKLRDEYPDSMLVNDTYSFSEEGTPRSVVEQLLRVVQDEQGWQEQHPGLFANPDPAADAPRVRIETDSGAILIALYPEEAPQHVENFLKLAGEDFYAGTKFHRIVRGVGVEAGDPNSKEGDATTWGQGSNGASVPHEDNGLHHFEGVLAAIKSSPVGDSSDCMFRITSNDAHNFDENYTVFGQVLEGLDVVRKIEEGETVDQAQNQFQPVSPVTILSTQVL